MASNDSCMPQIRPRSHWLGLTAIFMALAGVGCSVSGPRESPINEVTRGSPTVVDIYRGRATGVDAAADQETPQQRLRRESEARPIVAGDGNTRRYWSALEPLQHRVARVPNPDLVMVVYPHLAKGKYPVPGYVTVFPMYDQTHYALPGEVPEDLIEGRALFQKPAPERPSAKAAKTATSMGE